MVNYKKEVVPRALNFYQVKQKANREKERIYIVNEKREKMWVMA